MSILELIRAASPLLLVVAALFLASRRRFVRRLEKAQAYDDASAVAFPGSFPLQGWWQSRFQTAGVLKIADGGRYWLDRPAWQHYRAVRRRRGLTVLVCVVLGIAIALVLSAAIGRL